MAEQNVSYVERAEVARDTLEKYGAFYYAASVTSGKHGEEGIRNGLHATMWGLREKVGLEGIIESLEAEAEASIARGEGLNAEFNLSKFVRGSSNIFIKSALELKPADLIAYIRQTLDVEIEEKYSDRLLKDLLDKKASRDEKEYAAYLLSQLETSVTAKYTPLACKRKGEKTTQEYREQILQLPQKRQRRTMRRAA